MSIRLQLTVDEQDVANFQLYIARITGGHYTVLSA